VPFPPRFTPDLVHVEVIDWEISGAPAPAELARLSEEELARAGAFRHERDRARFIRARAGLREILGACTGCEAASVQLRTSALGKPELASLDGGLRFNLSHSGDRALAAIALGREVGVDLERVREGVDHVALARQFFTARERDAVLDHGGGSLLGFFRCWVAKEAYLKGRGDGIRAPLDSFEVDVEAEADCLRWTRLPDTRRWCVERVPLEGPYLAALACERGTWQVRRWTGLVRADT